MAEILPEIETFARIKVIGIGGGGGNALNRMVQSKLRGIDFVAINTDAQALHWSQANTKVHIGKEATRGLGAGANPEIGRQAAEESEEAIYNALKHSEMVFITAGYGGGTGSGAAPVVARIARDIGALTVAIITKPFSFEGDRRRKICEAGIEELKGRVDTLITIPNDRILQLVDRKTTLLDAFGTVDDVLKQGVQGIADLITVNGLVNLDFADVKSIMSNAGSALMGIGQGSGDTRAIDAVKYAMDSPLLDVSIQGAKGVLINFTGGRDMGMHEIEEAAKLIHDSVDPEANIIWGTVLDENLTGEIRVTLVATGFDSHKSTHPIFPPKPGYVAPSIFGDPDDAPAETESPAIPFLKDYDSKPVFDPTDDEPLVSAKPKKSSLFANNASALGEETIDFDFDEEDYNKESARTELPEEPIVETVSTNFDQAEDDDSDLPAYKRLGLKIGRPKAKKADDDMPSFVKKKL
ncbi:cell division protein FtsZ [Candidatus Saccharibacteria bacterium]|nr:cell division protein FtsZ [Candidatus Saccharibacteria bacterium]